jgi:DNA mismatch repair protein MSH6
LYHRTPRYLPVLIIWCIIETNDSLTANTNFKKSLQTLKLKERNNTRLSNQVRMPPKRKLENNVAHKQRSVLQFFQKHAQKNVTTNIEDAVKEVLEKTDEEKNSNLSQDENERPNEAGDRIMTKKKMNNKNEMRKADHDVDGDIDLEKNERALNECDGGKGEEDILENRVPTATPTDVDTTVQACELVVKATKTASAMETNEAVDCEDFMDVDDLNEKKMEMAKKKKENDTTTTTKDGDVEDSDDDDEVIVRKRKRVVVGNVKTTRTSKKLEEEAKKKKKKKKAVLESEDESDFAPSDLTSSDDDDKDNDSDFEHDESTSPVKQKKKAVVGQPKKTSKASAAAASTLKSNSHEDAQEQQQEQQQSGIQADAISRFDEREHRLFSFMFPPKLKDKSGNLFSSAEYDPTTLLLPKSFPKTFPTSDGVHKISPGQQQWWAFKADHFDAVLLFKMGKFYEMYEMDAHVGVKELGLIYMKGEQPHAGFPEKNYQKNAETLARNGHKVVTIEQTETPAMLAARKQADSRCKDTVVKREKIAVVTRGTMIDRVMVESCPDASHVLSISEIERNGTVHIGVCACECAAGRFVVGAYKILQGRGDEETLSSLRTTLCEMNPVEIIFPRGVNNAKQFPGHVVSAAIRDCAPNAHIRYVAQNMTSTLVREEIEKQGYFKPIAYPGVIEQFLSEADKVKSALAEAALIAWGTCLLYLNDNLVAHDVVPYAKYETIANDETFLSSMDNSVQDSSAPPSPSAMEGDVISQLSEKNNVKSQFRTSFMRMDAAALSGLEILENTEGGKTGTLLELISRAASAPGARILRLQCCRPSCDSSIIQSRQNAVDALRSNEGCETLGRVRKLLKTSPDYERCVARCVGSGDSNRNADRVVLYEDMRKAKLNDFLAALESIRAVRDVAEEIANNKDILEKSNLLRALVTGERCYSTTTTSGGQLLFPKEAISTVVRDFENAFDWKRAKECGRIEPASGVDDAVDAAEKAIRLVDEKLENWLDDARAIFQCQSSELNFVNVNSDTYLIEIPDRLSRRVPDTWTREGKRKGYERFSCETVNPLREARAKAIEEKDAAMEGVMKGLISKFRANWREWRLATECIAEVDALGALAIVSDEFSQLGDGHVVKPNVFPFPAEQKGNAFLECCDLTHPCATLMNKQFVPNDCYLGKISKQEEGSNGEQQNTTTTTKDFKNFLLLSGANMGGKSTYLRQVCLATILAHMGACVPAKTFNLSAVDAIFVRMGARDDLRSGFSTFAVEMSEIAKPLREATENSLVCVDELGRGTSTTDGCAIALACGKHLMLNNRSRTLFSTHYHKLTDYFAFSANCLLKHVEAIVDESVYPPSVTFTHKVTKGSCPKSHGVNVARLAGLPETVLKTASIVAGTAKRKAEENSALGGTTCSIAAKAGVQFVYSTESSSARDLKLAIALVNEALFDL